MTFRQAGCACCGGALAGLLSQAGRGWRGGRALPLGRRRLVAAGVAAAAIGAAAGAQPAPATVFSGGTILTVDGRFSEAEAVAIRGSRILAVGAADAVRDAAGPGATRVDLAGRTLLPGFVDPHTHAVAGGALDSITENAGAARFRTAAEVLTHLRARGSSTAPCCTTSRSRACAPSASRPAS
jgi:imidazolonepropionase-like amidohydrolase